MARRHYMQDGLRIDPRLAVQIRQMVDRLANQKLRICLEAKKRVWCRELSRERAGEERRFRVFDS